VPEPTPTDLATHLGIVPANIDVNRAQMLLDDAVAEALAIVTVGPVPDSGATYANLPPGADAVIRGAAGRHYLNTTGATSETVGPYSVTRPALTGATLSASERRKLLRLAGRGGAFEIETTPEGAADIIDPLVSPDLEDIEDVNMDFNY
jgi:hypothetical protein